MSLFADGAKRHCRANESAHNVFGGLHLADVDGVLFELEEIAQEERLGFVIDNRCKFFEFLVTACASGQLQCGNGLGRPGVADSVFAERVLPNKRQNIAFGLTVKGLRVHTQSVGGDGVEPDAAHR